MKASVAKREMPLHLMLLVPVLIVLVYSYFPMFGILIAFQKYIPARGFHSAWIGLGNFNYLLEMPSIFQVVWNTFFIATMKIIAGLIVPLVFALLLNEITRTAFKRTIQTLVYLPHFLSWVILSGILIDILSPTSGIVNQALSVFGIKPIFFIGDNHWFPFTLIASDVWKEFGFGTIVYLAALTGINPSLYEAAVIDGASRWKQTIYVTLPGLLPIIVLLAVLGLGNVLNAGFDQVFNLYSPSVYQSGDILDTMIYRIGIGEAQYGVSTAIGLFKSFVSFVLITVSYWLAYRFANYRIF